MSRFGNYLSRRARRVELGLLGGREGCGDGQGTSTKSKRGPSSLFAPGAWCLRWVRLDRVLVGRGETCSLGKAKSTLLGSLSW